MEALLQHACLNHAAGTDSSSPMANVLVIFAA
jgi:hypothetical protein